MTAEKARLFEDHRAVELIMSPDPSTHTNASVEAYVTLTPLLGTEKSNAVLSGNYANFTHNPAMKHHLVSTGNKRLAEASPLDPVWGIGLRADDPRAKGPRRWRGKYLLGEALSAIREEFATVRPSWHTRPPLGGSVLPRGMLESTKFRPRPVVLVDGVQRLPSPP